jgi:hypothetical protein
MILIALHNLLRWAVLIFGVWTVLNAATGYFSKRDFTKKDNLSNLFFMISCDIQLLLGLLLYFSNNWFNMLRTNGSQVMKDSTMRFFAMEHAVMMLLAWILVHIGRSAVKRADSSELKHKRMLIYFGVALLLILAAIPWPFRNEIGRGLFPQF